MAWDSDKATGDELTSDEWDAHVADQKGHASRHVTGGSDELTLDDLALPAGAFIDEDGGDFVVKDSNGNIVLRYDEATSSWVLTSLTTEKASITTVDGQGQVYRLIEREKPSSATDQIQFTGLSAERSYRLFIATAISGGGTCALRLNGDGASTGNYWYNNESVTRQTGQNHFLIATLSSGDAFNSSVDFGELRIGGGQSQGFNHRIFPSRSGRLPGFGREGAREVFDGISSVEIVTPSGDLSGGATVVELWERDYS